MIGIVMITRDEGPELEDALLELDFAAPDAPFVAIDLGSTDNTVARLKAFAKRRTVKVVSLDVTNLNQLEAMNIAKDMIDAPFLLALGGQDRLCSVALVALQNLLERADSSPDLIVTNSANWFADPSGAIPRADTEIAKALPQTVTAADLVALCPDPRRFVFPRDSDLLSKSFDKDISDAALYAHCVIGSAKPLFNHTVTMLHAERQMDPAPQLRLILSELQKTKRSERGLALGRVLMWSDDAVSNCPADQAPQLVSLLRDIANTLPREARAKARAHSGLSGPLYSALASRRNGDALTAFALAALARQQHKLDSLAKSHGALLRTVKSAVPDPVELRRLYNRARLL